VKFKPSEVSREEVQVVLRASTSTSPDCRAVKRSLAVSGTNLTLLGSLKIAAASARQKSTSRPVQRPCASGSPKPASVPLAPQLSVPRDFTLLRVWAEAACAARPNKAASATRNTTLFMTETPKTRAARACAVTRERGTVPQLSLNKGHLRTAAKPGQGVAMAAVDAVNARIGEDFVP